MKKIIVGLSAKRIKRPQRILGVVNMNPQCRSGGCC
jgi:hypothetical protein